MRVLVWLFITTLVLLVATPIIVVAAIARKVVTYVGDKTIYLINYTDGRLNYELDRERIINISRRYIIKRKEQ